MMYWMLLKRLYAYNHFGNILFHKIETCPLWEINRQNFALPKQPVLFAMSVLGLTWLLLCKIYWTEHENLWYIIAESDIKWFSSWEWAIANSYQTLRNFYKRKNFWEFENQWLWEGRNVEAMRWWQCRWQWRNTLKWSRGRKRSRVSTSAVMPDSIGDLIWPSYRNFGLSLFKVVKVYCAC